MEWEEFVKEFVAEIDYDISKDLDPKTAEVPEDAEASLSKLVIVAKELVKKYLCELIV